MITALVVFVNWMRQFCMKESMVKRNERNMQVTRLCFVNKVLLVNMQNCICLSDKFMISILKYSYISVLGQIQGVPTHNIIQGLTRIF